MREALQRLLITLGFAVWSIGGAYSLYLSFKIIHDAFGVAAALIGLFIAPLLLTIAPFYAGFESGNWYPFMVTYGTMGAGILLAGMAAVFSE